MSDIVIYGESLLVHLRRQAERNRQIQGESPARIDSVLLCLKSTRPSSETPFAASSEARMLHS